MTRPPPQRATEARSVILLVQRVFTSLAAAFLVAAVALVSLLPPDMSLRDAIAGWDDSLPDDLQHAVIGLFGVGLWQRAAMPVLVRPSWLMPVSLGLICIGGALTAHYQGAAGVKRKKS